VIGLGIRHFGVGPEGGSSSGCGAHAVLLRVNLTIRRTGDAVRERACAGADEAPSASAAAAARTPTTIRENLVDCRI
jgi:hypothetical protein